MNHRKLIAFAASLLLTLCGIAVAQQGIGWHFDMMRGSGSTPLNWNDAIAFDYVITNGASVTLPLFSGSGRYSMTVDWGDGSTSVCTGRGTEASHTYTSGDSNRVVKMLGKIYGIDSTAGTGMSGVSQWGNPSGIDPFGFYIAFNGRTGLRNIKDSLSYTWMDPTNLAGMFLGCSGLTNVSSVPKCPNNKSFRNVFNGCTKLRSVPFLDGSSVRDGFSMFFQTQLSNAYDTSTWTNLTILDSMYDSCTNLSTYSSSLSALSNVVSCASMFSSCNKLKNAPDMSAFNKSLPSLSSMYNSCYVLTNCPDISLFTNCTTLASTFYQCIAMQWRPNISGMTKLTTAASAFESVRVATGSLQAVVGDCGWITGQVKNVSRMFVQNYSMSGEGMPFVTAITNSPGYPTGYTVTDCFDTCTNLSDYATIPAAFK